MYLTAEYNGCEAENPPTAESIIRIGGSGSLQSNFTAEYNGCEADDPPAAESIIRIGSGGSPLFSPCLGGEQEKHGEELKPSGKHIEYQY
ncbi:MAG: hypothetical protein K5876_00935, partial [Ruminiclostridium sp.]|nr:hypothetical protein [Ruminiclostridium sp.]